MDFRPISIFQAISMRRISIAAAIFMAAAFPLGVSWAAMPVSRDFIVPIDDGYGMEDCLADGASCAKLVADSWCQINGMKTALDYSPAKAVDITASLAQRSTPQRPVQAYIVTCTD